MACEVGVINTLMLVIVEGTPILVVYPAWPVRERPCLWTWARLMRLTVEVVRFR